MIALVLAAAVTSAPVTDVAPLMERLSAGGLQNAKVGEFVTYRLKGGQLGEAYWRIAVVGEQVDHVGRPALWIEIDSGQHAKMLAPLFQMRLLVARGIAFDDGSITRAFVAMGTAKPQEVLPDEVPKMFEDDGDDDEGPAIAAPPETSRLVKVRKGEPKRLMTLAGTVTATPTEMLYRSTVLQRFWTSPQIPLLQFAKMEKPGVGYAMEIADFGVTAKPMMVLPRRDEPKIKLEAAPDEADADLGEGENDE